MDSGIPQHEISDFLISGQYQKHFWKYLIIIGAYYILPSLQFVYYQEQVEDKEKQDFCYFNYKCAHPVGHIHSFNNVISNIFYIILGIIFMLIVRAKTPKKDNRYGLIKDPSLYYSLGIGMILEGISSGIYHVCPSKLNFQFDTTFMFVGSALTFLTIYQKRHPRHIPIPFRVYAFLGLIVFLNVLPLSGIITGLEVGFWLIIYGLLIYLMTIGTINIYYGVDWAFDWHLPGKIWDSVKEMKPFNYPKFLLVLLINLYTLGMVIYAHVEHKLEFTTWLLSLFVINQMIYFMYYLVQKIKHNEELHGRVMISILANFTVVLFAVLFFTNSVTNKLLTPEESKALNKPCALFGYFDYHDIWHILSAIGLFMYMLTIFIIDRDLDEIPREEIAIF